MNSNLLRQIVASGIGISMLVASVTGLAYIFAPDAKLVTAIIGNLIAIPMAIAAWSGMFLEDKGAVKERLETPSDWLVMFLIASILSAIFIAIDMLIVHPGITLIFTFAACSMSVIALPSAVRAWILDCSS